MAEQPPIVAPDAGAQQGPVDIGSDPPRVPAVDEQAVLAVRTEDDGEGDVDRAVAFPKGVNVPREYGPQELDPRTYPQD